MYLRNQAAGGFASLATILLPLILGFPWYADALAYPFRMLTAGPNQPYGTWTGIVRVNPAKVDKDADLSKLEQGQRFGAVLVTVRPTLSRTFIGGWYFSSELVGTVLLQPTQGPEYRCHFKAGFADPTDHSFGALIIRGDNDSDSNGTLGGTFVPGKLHLDPSTCPYAGVPQLKFSGDLALSPRSSFNALIATLPALSAAADQQEESKAQALTGTWSGPASFWDPDKGSQPTAPNASLDLRIARTGPSPERFSATGTVHLNHGKAEDILLPQITFREGVLASEGFFANDPQPWTHNQEHSYFSLGLLDGKLQADHLILDKGGIMACRLNADLQHASAAPGKSSSPPHSPVR